jgi:hypothetical protein
MKIKEDIFDELYAGELEASWSTKVLYKHLQYEEILRTFSKKFPDC